MTRENKIQTASLIVLIGFTLAIVYHYVLGAYLGLSYPYNTFLFRPNDHFMDFVWPYRISWNPYSTARPDFQNFPILYRIASLFTWFNIQTALLVFLSLYVTFFLLINLTQLKTNLNRLSAFSTVFIFSFLTYPFLIAFDRANFEIVVFFCLYLFILLYDSHKYASASFLALAISLKAFPAILAILLLADKRYKLFIYTGCVALIITLLGYATFPGGIITNIVANLRNLELYNSTYAIGTEGLYFGNSIFGMIKFIIFSLKPTVVNPIYKISSHIINWYLILAALGLTIVIVYILTTGQQFWKRVAAAICALNLLPLVSGDYKLLHLFIPMYLFFSQKEKDGLDWIYTVIFGLMLIPKDYYHLPTLPEVSSSVLLNPLLMLALMGFIIGSDLKARLFRSDNLQS